MGENARMADFDPWAQLKLLELQKLDSHLDSLRHRAANLPEAGAAAKLRNQLTEYRIREVAGITEVADRELDLAKAEEDVQTVRQRSAKDQQLMDSGAISDPKQLTELQHEVASLSRRQAELEDAELQVMEQLEDANRSLGEVRATLAETEVSLAAAEAALTAVEAEIGADRAATESARAAMAAELPAELLKLYEKVRGDNGGVGAAMLHQGRCQGCGIQLTPVALSAARAAAPAALLRCDDCRAILVRTAESGL